MVQTYKTNKGTEIEIAKLSDDKLVEQYRDYMQFVRTIKQTAEEKPKLCSAEPFVSYAALMEEVKDSLKAEVTRRKIKLKDYV